MEATCAHRECDTVFTLTNKQAVRAAKGHRVFCKEHHHRSLNRRDMRFVMRAVAIRCDSCRAHAYVPARRAAMRTARGYQFL
jgi:hypothetical protein